MITPSEEESVLFECVTINKWPTYQFCSCNSKLQFEEKERKIGGVNLKKHKIGEEAQQQHPAHLLIHLLIKSYYEQNMLCFFRSELLICCIKRKHT